MLRASCFVPVLLAPCKALKSPAGSEIRLSTTALKPSCYASQPGFHHLSWLEHIYQKAVTCKGKLSSALDCTVKRFSHMSLKSHWKSSRIE